MPRVRFASVNSGPIPSSPHGLVRALSRAPQADRSKRLRKFVRHLPGRRDCSRASPAEHPAPADEASAPSSDQPSIPRGGQLAPAPGPLGLVHGHAADAPSLAPRACVAEVDLPKEQRVRPSSNSPNRSRHRPVAVQPVHGEVAHPPWGVWMVVRDTDPSDGPRRVSTRAGSGGIWRRQSTPIRSVPIPIRLVTCGFPRSPNGVRTRVSTLRVFSGPVSLPAPMIEFGF